MPPPSVVASIALLWLVSVHPATAQEPPGIVLFSSAQPGTARPRGWEPVKITDNKKPTEYRLVDVDGSTVLEAVAVAAASGLAQRISIDLNQWPVVEWRWRFNRLIENADNSQARTEDSPVRLVFEFEGDQKKLSFGDRAQLWLAKTISGREVPYSQLMYIWSNRVPVNTVIPNPRTGRVQMVVASSGSGGVGIWQSRSRNLREDYQRAYGEDPGRLVAYGVLSDTDNTGESVQAWYGDIKFKASR